jgi:uncharacterized protein DUF4145
MYRLIEFGRQAETRDWSINRQKESLADLESVSPRQVKIARFGTRIPGPFAGYGPFSCAAHLGLPKARTGGSVQRFSQSKPYSKSLFPIPYARMRLKHNETEVEFRLDEAKKAADQIAQTKAIPPPTQEETLRSAQVAARDPRAAMLEAWLEVEEALSALSETAHSPHKSPTSQIRWLRSKELIPPNIVGLLDDIRNVRNQVVHDHTFVPTVKQATEYQEIAETCAHELIEAREILIDMDKERV